MWDIKAVIESTENKAQNFHLNHVGYKVFSSKKKSKRKYYFHLNHVGYKAEKQERAQREAAAFI